MCYYILLPYPIITYTYSTRRTHGKNDIHSSYVERKRRCLDRRLPQHAEQRRLTAPRADVCASKSRPYRVAVTRRLRELVLAYNIPFTRRRPLTVDRGLRRPEDEV